MRQKKLCAAASGCQLPGQDDEAVGMLNLEGLEHVITKNMHDLETRLQQHVFKIRKG